MQVESEKERNDVQRDNNYLNVLICSFLRSQMSHPHFLLVYHRTLIWLPPVSCVLG